MSAKPSVELTVHMLITLDGKTTGSLFEATHFPDFLKDYYRIDREVFIPKSALCLSGRKCVEGGANLESAENFPALENPGDRSDFHADLDTYQLPKDCHYHAVVDPHGRLGWKANTIHSDEFPFYNGDRLVELLVEDWVTDGFLAQLRKANVPYLFAGKSELDCRVALEKLGKLFNTNKVFCHGGGTLNGTLLEQGLVDHQSLILVPSVSGDPSDVQLFNSMSGGKLPVTQFDLTQVEKLEHGGLWLQYSRKA